LVKFGRSLIPKPLFRWHRLPQGYEYGVIDDKTSEDITIR
jgi:hypothetical protein